MPAAKRRRGYPVSSGVAFRQVCVEQAAGRQAAGINLNALSGSGVWRAKYTQQAQRPTLCRSQLPDQSWEGSRVSRGIPCQRSEPPPVAACGQHSIDRRFQRMPAGVTQTPRVFSRACRSAGRELGSGSAATFGVSLFDALGAAPFTSTPLAEVKTVRVRAESDEPQYSLGHIGDLCFVV